jgi:nifR3 family TIM-barrel protein
VNTPPSPLRIGGFTAAQPLLLAPLAGYSDLAFRIGIRPLGGVGLAYTEMISPGGLFRGKGKKRNALLATSAEDRPLAYQIYGANVETLCAAARWVAEQEAVLVDINMGCPQRKIATHGAGAGLLINPDTAVAIAARVVESVKLPVTAKLRLGWDPDSIVAPALAAALENVGIAAITIHGRTRSQGYSGTADLDAIRAVVQAVKRIPVIGNGDVTSPPAARRMLTHTGCAGLMIGRGAMANPWLMRDIWNDLSGAPPAPPPTRAEWLAYMQAHFERMQGLYGAETATVLYRKWIVQYVRKLLPDRRTMVRWLQIRDPEEMKKAMETIALPTGMAQTAIPASVEAAPTPC